MACPLAFRDRQQPRPPFDRYKLGRPPPLDAVIAMAPRRGRMEVWRVSENS